MPIYIFQNPNTGETKEIVQKMNDLHVYREDGVLWNRLFTIPQASIDTDIDPLSQSSWNEKTKNKTGTVGDLIDKSKELSEKRERIIGKDPIREKYFDNYKKTSNGQYHQDDPRKKEESNKRLKKLGVSFED